MRKAIGALIILVLAAIILPPAYYALVGESGAVELPPPGRMVPLRGGAELNVLDSGQGPAIVLVHGLPGCAYDWTPLPERLAAGAPGDRLRSCGLRVLRVRAGPRATTPTTTTRPSCWSCWRLSTSSDATLVGWSYGGGVVIRAGLRGSERIGRLVLLGSVGPAIEIREPGVVRGSCSPGRFSPGCR